MLKDNLENEPLGPGETPAGEQDSYNRPPDGNSLLAGLNKSQKIAIAVLAFFAFITVIVWMVQLRNRIYSPFEYKGPGNTANQAGETCSGPDCPENIAELKSKDTDGDGLNDYEELNVYKTSPYLEDSDSDGYNDKNELDSGNNPNCPVGKDCGDAEPLNGDTVPIENTPVEGGGIDDVLGGENLGSWEDLSEEEAAIYKEFFGAQSDPDVVRDLLIESGLDPAQLEQISDEELMKSLEEVLKE